MKSTYHQELGDPRPKRGDLIQSNIGTARERTWIVIQTRPAPTRFCAELGRLAQRTKIWAERWWEMEPELRLALFRSAERHGGQVVHLFYRFKAKKPRTFNEHMRRNRADC